MSVLGIIAAVFFCTCLAAGFWCIPRITRLAERRGYRGPFALVGPHIFVLVILFGGFQVIVATGSLSEAMAAIVLGVGELFALAVSWVIVALLPRRPARVSGLRRTTFPFTNAALTLVAASIVVPAMLLVIGWGVLESVRVGYVLFGLAALCGVLARRARARQAESAADLDVGGSAVLLLRGFYDDHLPFSASDARRGRRGLRRWIGYVLQDNGDFLTAECYLGPAIRASVGPLVGLGNPTDYLPPDGPMLRHYAADAEWQDVLVDRILQARAVVVLAGPTESLMFEMLLVRALRAHTRTFLVVPPQQHEPVREWLARRRHKEPLPWSTLVSYFMVLGYFLPTTDPGPGVVIGFSESGHAVVLASAAETADTYAAAIAGGLDGPSSLADPEPTTDAFLIDRLAAELTALRLLTRNPKVVWSKRATIAFTYRIVVADEVGTQLCRRTLSAQDSGTTEDSPGRNEQLAAAEPRRAWLRDIGDGFGHVNESVVEILTSAWLGKYGGLGRPQRPRIQVPPTPRPRRHPADNHPYGRQPQRRHSTHPAR